MQHHFGKLLEHQPFVWLCFAIMLLVLGALILRDLPATQRRIAAIERLPLVSQAVTDQPALIEGRISDQMVPLHKDFVAYSGGQRG